MSLILGARSMAGANSSRRLADSLRAFQTLSPPTNSTSNDIDNRTNKNALTASPFDGQVQWSIMATPTIQTAATMHFSSLSKLSFSPPNLNAINSIARTTRSMGGEPESQDFRDGKPTLEYAKRLPKTFGSMTNDQVLHYAELGIPEACRECIVRDVMVVDQIEYDEAMEVFTDIAKTNREGMFVAALPFYIGLTVSVTAGYASFPLVFDLSVVEWFNEHYVTSEMPPPEDLETPLEVGAASWSWMEPVLGQVSFFLLAMQFARSQLQNLGMRPYHDMQKQRRAAYLVRMYPKYDAQFLMNYSRIDRLAGPHDMSKK